MMRFIIDYREPERRHLKAVDKGILHFKYQWVYARKLLPT